MVHNSVKFLQKFLIQHTIRFVQNEEFQIRKVERVFRDEIFETAGRSDENVAAVLEIRHLSSDDGASVHDDRLQNGIVRKFARLPVNLNNQLASGCDDNDFRFLGPVVRSAIHFLFKQHINDRNEISSLCIKQGGEKKNQY